MGILTGGLGWLLIGRALVALKRTEMTPRETFETLEGGRGIGETTNKISSPEWDESDHVITAESFSGATTSDYIGGQTEQIRAEIEDTRPERGQTINEIQERLNPEHLVNQVKESVREATIGKVEKANGDGC